VFAVRTVRIFHEWFPEDTDLKERKKKKEKKKETKTAINV